MLRELVELGRNLREEGKLPPVGYADYSAPIKWVLRLRLGDPPRAELREAELDVPRPDSNRAGKKFTAYPLVDQGAYVLGSDTKRKGETDKNAAVKQAAFRTRLDELADAVDSESLREAICLLANALDRGVPQELAETEGVAADEWVAITVVEGPLADQYLFEHPEILRFWRDWMNEDTMRDGYSGTCSVTGEEGGLVRKIPGKGHLMTKASLLGYNEDAYVSFVGGGGAAGKTSIGLSYEAADTANRALEYLARSDRHSSMLLRVIDSSGKQDNFASHKAIFWIDQTEPVEVEGRGDVNPADLLGLLSAPLPERPSKGDSSGGSLTQLRALLEVPWKPKSARLRLNDYTFYLAVLSQYTVRVVVREWLALDLGSLKDRLRAYLDAASLVQAYGGEVQPVSVGAMLGALDHGSPNLARHLLRAVYAGDPLPRTLLQPALARLRRVSFGSDDRQKPYREHALLALVKFVLTHHTPDAMTLQRLDPARNERAYLCGCLFAVLEKVQQEAHAQRTNASVTARYYGAASTAPSAILANLIRTATVAHLPKMERDKRGLAITRQKDLQDLMSRLDEAGGFPPPLSLDDQAEFALGYYHQRADLWTSKSDKSSDSSSTNDNADDA